MAVPVPAVDVVPRSRVDWRFVVPYVVPTVAMWMSTDPAAPGADGALRARLAHPCLVTLGYALGTTYLLYFLRDRIGVADPAGGVFTANIVPAAALLVTVFVGGVLSDVAPSNGRPMTCRDLTPRVLRAGGVSLGGWPTTSQHSNPSPMTPPPAPRTRWESRP